MRALFIIFTDEDDVVSGWGELEEEVEEKEELSRKWGVALDEWEAKAGTIGHRPKELFELCRKVGIVWESQWLKGNGVLN